ncbi:hypothetical protein HYH38_16085 [Clostridium botulinum]|uniref:Uncharacterized protein n=1 Tax=Clostridium botulinum TaxID=1491 RepID=A0A126JIE3_CLOBO|nr:hypothetical protein [Clostridium botulinum]ALT05455.1 hypothetical protein [Clostridium botulinum]ALT05553.1 hypothetical protein [Clostridium botulinum]MBY6810983.1 hypothetical protein [Clostridium botulinum]MBY6818460.1 hypothetical protein [Clostridium botulinum]MBY6824451.1 hypothetical protein [Clostridium botulinum]
MKRWKINFKIKSYLIFTEEFTMNNFNFFCIDKQNYASCKVEAESMKEAEEYAKVALDNTLKMNEFILDEKFTCIIDKIDEEIIPGEEIYRYRGAANIESTVTVVKPFYMERINEINNFKNLLLETNDIGNVAYECYLKGLEIYQWNTEAFLNFFKSIETISAQYLDKGKEEKKSEVQNKFKTLTIKLKKCVNEDKIDDDKVTSLAKQIYNLGFIEVRKKINLAIQDLGVEVNKDKLDKIVKLRPKVAHGGTVQNVIDEDLQDCKYIAKEIILSYIKKYKKQ